MIQQTQDREQEQIDKIKKYFRYDYSGVLVNTHDNHQLIFAGSDYDYDILFSTDNEQIVNNTYTDEIVTAYDVPKPAKKPNLTDEDLYLSDTFSFGQQIGQITNVSTSIYALLPLFEKGSKEYELLISRLKQCCVNQSKQIDKTKIGRAVKSLPKIWNTFQKPSEDDTQEQIAEKEFYNSIIVDRKPYFFKYKYKQLAKEIRAFERDEDYISRRDTGKPIKEILSKSIEEMDEDELRVYNFYRERYPAIDTPCIMNNIAHYIEDIDFHIKQRVRSTADFDYKTLMSDNFTPNKKLCKKIEEVLDITFKNWNNKIILNSNNQVELNYYEDTNKNKIDKKIEYNILLQKLEEICPIEETLANHLIYIFYELHPSYSKSILWSLAGRQIYQNIEDKTNSFYFPIKDENGSIEFLYEKYQAKKINVDDLYDYDYAYMHKNDELPQQKQSLEQEKTDESEEDIFDKLQVESGI